MLAKFLKTIFKTGKKASRSVEESLDFFDEILEKEYITTGVDKAREATGKVAEEAGKVYQRSRNYIDNNVDVEKLRDTFGKALEKGKEATSEMAENMLDSSEMLKNVVKEGKDMVNRFMEEEE